MSESVTVDCESSSHPSKLRSLLSNNAVRSGPGYLTAEPEASDQTFTNHRITCSPNLRHGNLGECGSGYLLSVPCNVPVQEVNSHGRFRNLMLNYGEDENNASLNNNINIDTGRDLYSHDKPGFGVNGYEVSSSLPSPMPTSTPITMNTLPIFMSPMEAVKPCPQYCRCHGFNSVSSPDYNGNVYQMPDLLHNTKPDQFSSTGTSSTMCLNSPLVCPGHFQPMTSSSLKTSLPSPANEGVDVGSSSTSSLSTTPIVNDPKSLSNEQQGPVYPIEVVPSDWLSTLVKKGIVNEGNELEPATPATMNSVSEAEADSSQTSLPAPLSPTSSQNYGILDGSSSQNLENSPSIDVATSKQQTTQYRDIYPRIYPGVYPRRPDVDQQPNFTVYGPSNIPPYPPPEYPSHHSLPKYLFPASFGNDPGPSPPRPGYHHHPMMMSPMHHAQPPSGFFHGIGNLVMDKQFPRMPIPQRPLPRDMMVDGEVDDHGSPFNSGDDQRVKRQRVPHQGGRLVDQFPDLLPAVAWCINYSQTSSSTTLTAEHIRKIVIESVPGIKDRGGISLSVIRRLIRQAKNMPNKVGFDQTETTKTSTMGEASISLMKLAERALDSNSEGNTTELPQDPVVSSLRYVNNTAGSDAKQPAEPVLLSIMKLVDTIPKARVRSKASKKVKSADRSLGNDAKPKLGSTASKYSNDNGSTSDSSFQSLMEAHGIAEDEVKSLSNVTESFHSPRPADYGERSVEIDSANDPSNDDRVRCDDSEGDYVIVIDEDDDQNTLKITY
ncbi:uncharacterized protein LOC121409299 [Lytechinus variegatus]|uniref:uncharacterized protein LOC121409299 n=1 Tax=Lytechinus variegatus TaxID=7654 RepID=UPI001BB207CB|nr:uncharacterized protein LOC121409299 [Lytechinus variegatus]